MSQYCEFCKVRDPTEPDMVFCQDCSPTICAVCNSDLELNQTDRCWECGNGHREYITEYLDRIFKERLNYSKEKKIKYAGNRVEAIIPCPEKITQIALDKDDIEDSESELVLHHYTSADTEKIVSEGLQPPSEIPGQEPNESYRGSIRYNSVYGWPFKPDVGPTEYHSETVIYFTIPFEETVISSYTYLEYFQFGEITLDEYETDFCFSPQKFLSICHSSDRPYKPNQLLTTKLPSKL